MTHGETWASLQDEKRSHACSWVSLTLEIVQWKREEGSSADVCIVPLRLQRPSVPGPRRLLQLPPPLFSSFFLSPSLRPQRGAQHVSAREGRQSSRANCFCSFCPGHPGPGRSLTSGFAPYGVLTTVKTLFSTVFRALPSVPYTLAQLCSVLVPCSPGEPLTPPECTLWGGGQVSHRPHCVWVLRDSF